MPCTHIWGRNRLALQASRFSHDCESLMRCTKSDARVQAQAEVLGRTRKRGGLRFTHCFEPFHAPDMQWLWFRDVRQGDCRCV
jgi:hypothetical protein